MLVVCDTIFPQYAKNMTQKKILMATAGIIM